MITIRRAALSDADTIAKFNRAMALETEGINLIPEVIRAGVQRLLEQPQLGFYLLAMRDQTVAGSLMITTEWSDWRNGVFWWVQSVYVLPEFRRRGIYRSLYNHVKQLAQNEDVCGFRLYVEQDNSSAMATYRALGMSQTPYRMFEELTPGTKFLG